MDAFVVAALTTQGLIEFAVEADAVRRTLAVQPRRLHGDESLEPIGLRTKEVVVIFEVDVAPDLVAIIA